MRNSLLLCCLLALTACSPTPAPEERPLLPLAVEEGESLYLPLVAVGDAPPDPYPPPDATATVDAPPMPTETVMITPTPLALADYPLCAEHDPTQWHSLTNEAAQCHYDHEHGDDPHVLDWLFGSIGEEWDASTISYPWLTPGENEHGNTHKHSVYKWIVVKDLPCVGELSFSNLRMQVHADGNLGATTRHHSFYLQAEACDMNDPTWRGQVLIGGHIDFGNLIVTSDCARLTRAHVPLPGDAGEIDLETESHQRIHHTEQVWNCRSSYQNMPDHRFSRWYGSNNSLDRTANPNRWPVPVLAFGMGDWGWVDPADPYTPVQDDGSHRGALIVFHELRILIPERRGSGGLINWHGYVNEWGEVKSGRECPSVSPTCIPVHVYNMKPGLFRLDGVERGLEPTDHSLGQLEWIEFPNREEQP